ncbi:MAG TPA: hypothetical protein PLB55_04770 [Prosthecobacter sp.]|nr:hypothetical protein [Prosthecobacter sp.]
MTCYIVTFETKSEVSRQRVKDRLKQFGRFCPIHKYCWAILTEQSAKEVRDEVAKSIDTGERIFVIRSGTEAAWKNSFGEKNNAWLKKNL